MSELKPLFYKVFTVRFCSFIVRIRVLNFNITALTKLFQSLISSLINPPGIGSRQAQEHLSLEEKAEEVFFLQRDHIRFFRRNDYIGSSCKPHVLVSGFCAPL